MHLAVSILPKYAVLQLVEFWSQHVWLRGYCVGTVNLVEERIKKYVKWQNQKGVNSEATQGRLFD